MADGQPERAGTPRAPGTLEERIAGWSLYQPWLQSDPLSHWQEIREHAPIVRSEEGGGFWILTRYEDIEWAARNPDLFSSAELAIPHRQIFPGKQIPIQLDGVLHRKWRQTLSDLFNPNMVNHFTPQIEQAARELVDRLVGAPGCDFVPDFASALPAETFLITYGIGREHLDSLLNHKTWLRREGLPSARTDEEIREANRPLWEFFGAAIDRRREAGTEGRRDVLSQLLRSTFDGRPPTRDEMINTAFVAMLASLDTTTASLSLQFLYLANHPETRRLIVAEPRQLPLIVEELIRHEPVASTGRVVTQDVERHGTVLRRGDRVLLSWGFSGRDPRVFDRPDEVDFDRLNTRHLGFGVGPHRCLGMHLARRIIKVAFREWHARIPDYHLDPETTPIAHYSPGRGLSSLKLLFDPSSPTLGAPAAGADRA